MRPLDDFEVPSAPFLSGVAAAGDEVTVPHPSSGLPVSFTLPLEYRKGDSGAAPEPRHDSRRHRRRRRRGAFFPRQQPQHGRHIRNPRRSMTASAPPTLMTPLVVAPQ